MEENLEELEGKIVIPGDFVIVERPDIVIGEGLVKENGRIYAVRWGIIKVKVIDGEQRKYLLYIKSKREPIIPKRGDLVLGEITNVGNTVAMLRIFFILRKNEETGGYVIHYLPVPYQGLIHISYVLKPKASRKKLLKKQNKHEKQDYLFNYLAIGDIILGKIIVDYTVPYGVVIRDVYYGVVAARCSRCGSPLELRNHKGELTTYCNVCRKPDPRKFSVLYDYQLYSTLLRLYKSRKYAYSPEAEW